MKQISTIRKFQMIILILVLGSCSSVKYNQELKSYRKAYKAEFNSNEHAPLKAQQLKDMRFYPPNTNFKVEAVLKINEITETFEIPTSSGSKKEFYKYADAFFEIDGKKYHVEIIRNIKLLQIPKYKDYLFLPFYDLTNGEETYGGGRYIDLDINDIKNNKLIIDFNKCYNPYCAYSIGYNCPIPPVANRLETAIKAGEKLYAGEYIGEPHD